MVDLLLAYSKRLDLLSELVSAVERLQARDGEAPKTGRSVRSDQAPQVWRVSDRLSEAERHSLVSHYLAGITARELAERFKISKSSVKRLLRERGIRRTTFVALRPQATGVHHVPAD
jgi:DNA-directed RNA polymerase specialized sigma24 family protein